MSRVKLSVMTGATCGALIAAAIGFGPGIALGAGEPRTDRLCTLARGDPLGSSKMDGLAIGCNHPHGQLHAHDGGELSVPSAAAQFAQPVLGGVVSCWRGQGELRGHAKSAVEAERTSRACGMFRPG
jgi:hypothetical protein